MTQSLESIGADLLPDSDTLHWSALATDLDSGEVLLSVHPERSLNTASIGKVFLLHTVLSQVDAGELDLDEEVTRSPHEWMDDSGLWYLLRQDRLRIYDICALIGAVSDNFATNVLTRRIGIDVVARHTAEMGYTDSALDDIVRWPIPVGAPKTLSHGSAAELHRFLAEVARNESLSPASCDILRRWLGAGMDCSMVASAFNLDPLAHYYYDHDLWLWNKTGTISTVRGDIGVAMSPERRVAYAVLANWDRAHDARDETLARMRDAGDRIRQHLLSGLDAH
ncbi:MAG: class A beta-lactamase-related serine hydrolase [Microbacteriaceae bacterium]|jgi:beta-lactamase class A|nr:class A beta-lactamase-related serine hydrolase [Microbacteriaceae bacterium]MCI1207427.1 class A beta-lactamase-related serine hydrolase [Microbacteriaceae bacterium]